MRRLLSILSWWATVAAVVAVVLLLSGCAYSTHERSTVRLETPQGPIHGTIDTEGTSEPQPPAAAAPALDWLGMLSQVAGVVIPGGGIAAGALGLLAEAGRRKAIKHRTQLIKGIEDARDELPEDMDRRFTLRLAARQDEDLQTVVQKVTA